MSLIRICHEDILNFHSTSNKRTRSPSAHSEQQPGPAPPAEFPAEKLMSQAPKSAGSRNKRGGRKNAVIEVATIDIEEGELINAFATRKELKRE